MDYGYEYGYSSSLDGGSVGSAVAGAMIVVWIIVLAVSIISIIGMVKLFKKFGKPGWAAIVPIYNTWVLFEMGGLPGWLSLIPMVNYVCVYIAYFKIAQNLGKSTGFAICTIFFLPICMLIMAFDKSYPINNGGYYNNQMQGQPMNNGYYNGQMQGQPVNNYQQPMNQPPVQNMFVPNDGQNGQNPNQNM